jgi:4-hydroxybenzoate polyprenyltransferase
MKSSSRLVSTTYFLVGLGIVLFGMVSEFVLGIILPSEVMQGFYFHGGFLTIIIPCFWSGVLLIRKSFLGQWRYRYDSVIYFIAAAICLASGVQTFLGMQIGHPYLELRETNPILMNLLWIFGLSPLDPWVLSILGGCLIVIAWINVKTYPLHVDISKEIQENINYAKPMGRLEILGGLTRASVWLGSIFLLILSFLIIGSPPLSPAPNIPLYQPLTWLRLLLGSSSVCLLNSAAFILNQIGDVDTDQLHSKKARLPVSAGRIRRNKAALLAVGFILVGMLLAFSLGAAFTGVVCFIFIFALVYSFPPIRLKGRPFLDLVIIGLAFGTWAVLTAWGILTIWRVNYAPIPGPDIPLTLLIGAGLFYAGTHCIHTATDYQADAKANINTTAVYIGPRRTTKLGVILIAVGLLMVYSAVGYFTHLFWYGLLKYKSIFLLIFLGLPFFALLQQFHTWQQSKESDESYLQHLQQKGRWVTYLLFLILLIYLLFYVFLFYPVYYPNYFFPWV